MKTAKKIRKNYYYRNLMPLPIEDLSMFPKPNEHPIMFEEVYLKDRDLYESTEMDRHCLSVYELSKQNEE